MPAFEFSTGGRWSTRAWLLTAAAFYAPHKEAQLKSFGLFQTETAPAPGSAAALIAAAGERMAICSFASLFFSSDFSAFPGPFVHNITFLFLRKRGAAGDEKPLPLSPAFLERFKPNAPQHLQGDK